MILIILLGILLRLCVSLHSYSGQNKPPMFGDYEAQRHWMEITFNLPVKEWYFNSTNNDLMYWGLDYPPLTAYHSLVCGHIAAAVNSKYVELYNSRGFESDTHKHFMRFTVLVSDITTFIPAIVLFFIMSKNTSNLGREMTMNHNEPVKIFLLLTLTYPGLILIDHGHFQYNCVSLGFFVFAVTAVMQGRHLIASSLFCCAFLYKQMELYHALPFFFYLLGDVVFIFEHKGIFSATSKLASLAGVVVMTVGLICFPFITSVDQVTQLLIRLFPIARGVFEDKVANFWCLLNIFYKLKLIVTNATMAKVCAVSTLLAVIPSSYNLFKKHSTLKFKYSLVNSSLAFFLFSYQVHEKSILLASVPILLILPHDPKACVWFLNVSVFSMLPLLLKDQLFVPYIGLSTLFIFLYQVSSFDRLLKSSVSGKITNNGYLNLLYIFVSKYLYLISMFGCLMLTIAITLIRPLKRYPDIFPLLISAYSCVHFLAFLIYFNIKQWNLCETKGKGE